MTDTTSDRKQRSGADNHQAIRQALSIFLAPGQTVSIQALKIGSEGKAKAYGSASLDDAVEQAACFDQQKPQGVYFTPNPIRPEWLRQKGSAAFPCDKDMQARRWILTDFDPVRPAGTNASEAERRAAWSVLCRCRGVLEAAGVGGFVVGDSGNGWHLSAPLLLPNNGDSKALIRAVLRGLQAHCGDRLSSDENGRIRAGGFLDAPKATVGEECFDARRIWPCYGTWKRKGAHSTERPQRQTRIIEGEPWQEAIARANVAALLEQLRRWQAQSEPRQSSGLKGKAGPSRRDKYVQKAFQDELDRIASASPGQRNTELNSSSFSIGQLVGAGAVLRRDAEEAIFAAAQRAGCDNPTKDWETIHRGLNAGVERPRDLTGLDDRPSEQVQRTSGEASDSPEEAKQERPRPEVFTASALLAREIPEPRWAIEGLLPEGMAVLSGKPKMGKSWLALNLSIAVATGGMALDKIEVKAGDVLYLALEDTQRRLQRRLRALLGDRLSTVDLTRLHLNLEWPRAGLGGLQELERWLQEHEHRRLVILDTWPKFRPRRRTNADRYEEDYEHGAEVKKIADRYGVAILALCHNRKMSAEDPFDEISGTLGLGGAADTLWVLRRDRGDKEGTLHITGRDVDDAALGLEWLAERALWRLAGEKQIPLSEKTRARDWLRQFLASKGDVNSNDCVKEGNAALGLNKHLKWWRDDVFKEGLGGKPRKLGKPPDSAWFWGLPVQSGDSSDSSDSSQKTREKRGGLVGAAVGGTMQKPREIPEESEESEESQTCTKNGFRHGYIAPDADPAALVTPFETNGEVPC